MSRVVATNTLAPLQMLPRTPCYHGAVVTVDAAVAVVAGNTLILPQLLPVLQLLSVT